MSLHVLRIGSTISLRAKFENESISYSKIGSFLTMYSKSTSRQTHFHVASTRISSM
jgi:hypothetical protein